MRSGELDQRLIFQYPDTTTDADGFPVNTVVEYARTWAKLKTLRGNQFYIAASENMMHNREFQIRYRSDLADDQRPSELEVVWRGKKHEILSIENDDGQNSSMTVICQAVSR